jgi:hypothetical protein
LWILLQPSPDLIQRVENGMQWQRSSTPNPVDRSLRLHASMIFAGSAHWADYLDDLQSRLEKLVSCSSFYKIKMYKGVGLKQVKGNEGLLFNSGKAS